MGIGSAFTFIGTLKLAALWLPREHFALFAGITTALGTIGAILADVLLARISVAPLVSLLQADFLIVCKAAEFLFLLASS